MQKVYIGMVKSVLTKVSPRGWVSVLWTVCLLFFIRPSEENFVFENETDAGAPQIASDVTTVSARVDKLLAHSLSRFALGLEAAISKTNPADNVIFSPLSIASVLAMVLLGARNDTAKEISNVLGFSAALDLTGRPDLIHEQLGVLQSQLQEHGYQPNSAHFSIGNAVFVQEGIPVELDFIKHSIAYYSSDVRYVEFRRNSETAKNVINKWVSDNTHGHIQNFLSGPPSQETNIILASALYFNGEWEYPFNTRDTSEQPFYIIGTDGKEEEIKVDMMVNSADIPYYDDRTRKCRIIGLPYKGNQMIMYLVMPDYNVHDLLNNLSVEDLENLVNNTKVNQVLFYLPRMKLENTILLKYPLEEMGVSSLFQPGKANLNGISKDIFITEAIHKVEIEVSEKGTVASAATLTMVLRTSAPIVNFERPFIFFIQHIETSTIIFWGTVVKPTI